MIKLRQSEFKHYFRCPKKMVLAGEHDIEMNDAMREGLLFEGYVFGKFKDDNEEELIGRKKKPTIDGIKAQAEKVKPLFLKGEPFVKMEHVEADRLYHGEIDYVGIVDTPEGEFEGLVDLKKTGSIDWVWDSKTTRASYMQASFYPYLYYLINGEIKDFLYVIVEDKYPDPIIAFRKFNIKDNAIEIFSWLETKLNKIVEDIVKPAIPNGINCLYGGRCSYLEWCKEGREFVGGYKEVDWTELRDDRNVSWDEIKFRGNVTEQDLGDK